MPLLDVLQSGPFLLCLRVVLLSLSALVRQAIEAEVAAVVLIFTSQAWNLTYSFHQSPKTRFTHARRQARRSTNWCGRRWSACARLPDAFRTAGGHRFPRPDAGPRAVYNRRHSAGEGTVADT